MRTLFKVLTPTKLFYLSIWTLIIGSTLVGISIGLYFHYNGFCLRIGALLGFSIGLICISFISFRILKHLMIFDKKEL